MKALVYYISLPFIYGISLLPFWFLYRLSDLLYLVLYKLFAYRTKVVRENLVNSFPEMDSAELLDLEKKFYSYLCDLILEAIKTLTIGPKGPSQTCHVS